MPGPNLMMAREGTHFAGDGVKLAWPRGGTREISPKPENLSRRLSLRIANGYIVETDEPATVSLPENHRIRLLTGQAARDRLAQRSTPKIHAAARISDESHPIKQAVTEEAPASPPGASVAVAESAKPRPRPKGALAKRGRS